MATAQLQNAIADFLTPSAKQLLQYLYFKKGQSLLYTLAP